MKLIYFLLFSLFFNSLIAMDNATDEKLISVEITFPISLSINKKGQTCLALRQKDINNLIQILELKQEEISAKLPYLPNELLLLILKRCIDNIVFTSSTIDAKIKFKEWLKSICWTNRHLHTFKQDLIDYFKSIKFEIGDLQFGISQDRDEFWISFKINNLEFRADANNEEANKLFAHNILTIPNGILEQLGKEIAKECSKNDLANIWSAILSDPYEIASEEGKSKIRTLIIPIFKAYPTKNTSLYHNGVTKYALKFKDIGLE